jgi:hypothetical protein
MLVATGPYVSLAVFRQGDVSIRGNMLRVPESMELVAF